MTDENNMKTTCLTCGSKYPHRHPAVSFEGEVEICTDDFHLTPTAANKSSYIAAVHEKRVRKALETKHD